MTDVARLAGTRVARALPIAVAVLAALAAAPTLAQDARDCASIDDDRQRLDCHDRATGRIPPEAVPPVPATPGAPTLDEAAKRARDERRARGGSLGERWELDPGTKQGRFVLRPYKPMYLLPVRWSSAPNQTPSSEGVGNTVSQAQGISATEALFQVSMKTKVWETVADTNLDLWVAYTQKSHWQVYSAGLSRPFRETNYEPEVFGIWGLDQPLLGGWRARFVGLGINHQSNGRSEPLSRSWNRLVAQAGFENDDWSVLVRPWWRIRERTDDDNPGIEDGVGRGELVITRRTGAHQLSVQLRHSLRGGDRSHGSVVIDWAFPLSSYLKGHVQLFSGRGESLIDFNHRQTTVGLGLSLVEWQ
jgi:phospholipase A1